VSDELVPVHARPQSVDDLPLLRVIDRIRASEEEIRARVEARRARLAERGLTGRMLADELAAELVDEARWRAATIGATSALPFTIPVLGFWGTLLFTVVGAALWQLAIEVELVYALAIAYGVRLEPERMRLVSFWLVQLTNYDDLRGRALTIGVRLTVRKLVEKLIAVGMTRAFEATAHSVAIVRMMGRVPVEPWYVRATQFLGVPLLLYFGWKSASGVGERATAYFQEEAGLAVIEGGRS
jgi:hypothetical protein